MADLLPGYVIDTSALLDLHRRKYPRDVFPTLWDSLEKLIEQGWLVAPREVQKELEPQRDKLCAWIRKQAKLIQDLDAEQIATISEILKRFPTLVDPDKPTPEADPMVIAMALARGWAVITSEDSNPASRRAKIPDVCTAYGVRSLSLLEFFREKDWKF